MLRTGLRSAIALLVLSLSVPSFAETAGSTAPSPAARASREAEARSGTRTAAYVLGGLALAGIGTGTAFGILALEQKGIRDDHCSEAQRLCDAQGVDANDLGRRYLTYSMIGFALGGLSLAGSIWLFQKSSEGYAVRADVSPTALELTMIRHW